MAAAGKDVGIVRVQQIDLFERPVSHSLHSIFLSASPSFHACLTWRAIAKSDHTKYTAAEALGRSHIVPATPGFLTCYPQVVLLVEVDLFDLFGITQWLRLPMSI